MTRFAKWTVVALLAAGALGCSPDQSDYWASLEMDAAVQSVDSDADADGDSDGDTDTDTDGDTDGDTDTDTDDDTDSECADTSNTCGDGGADADSDSDADAGPTFCDSVAFINFMAQTPLDLDNTGAPYRGNAGDPELVVTSFANFTCSWCKIASGIVEELYADPLYWERTVYYFRHFPFSESPGNPTVRDHRAAEAANMQGRFFSFHDALYDDDYFPVSDETTLLELAESLYFDMDQFDEDYASAASLDRVLADRVAGIAAGVGGTPTFFVDGRRVAPWTMLPDVLDCLLGYTSWDPPDGGL